MLSMFLNKIIKSLPLFCFAFLCISHARADNFEYSGFISQGYINSTDNNFLGNSSEGSFELSEAVINSRYSINDDWYLAGQLLTRNYGDYHIMEEDITIDYALVGGKLFSESYQHASIQLGMVKNPFGLFNISRDIPTTHLGILLPQNIYNEYNRNKSMRNLGFLVEYNNTQSWGDIQGYLALGKIDMPKSEHKDIYATAAGMTDDMITKFSVSPDLNKTFQLLYSTPNKHIRLGYTYSEGDYYYEVEGNVPVYGDMNNIVFTSQNLDIKFRNNVLSAELHWNDLTLISEYMHRRYSSKFNFYFLNNHMEIIRILPNTETIYLQASYAITYNVELFARHEEFYWDTEDKSGSNQNVDSALGYHKASIFGVDWNINENILLKAEYHKIKGCPMLHWAETDYNSLTESWSMYLLQFVYHF